MQIKLNELTLDNLGTWPTLVKAVVVAIVFILVIFLGYCLDIMGQLDELAAIRNQQETLLETITIKQDQAANLNAYKQQQYQIDSIFNELLRCLPTSSEVPGLLDDISKTGIANGLTFVLFKPEPEIKKGFYAELPIQISVIGSYHQLGQFISDMEGLDRIVTLHDFTIKPVSLEELANLGEKKAEPGQLGLTITARTYRYVEKEVVDTSKSKPIAPIAPLPPVQAMQRAVYQAGNLRDPFQPSKKNISENVNPSHKKQPLEAFPLNSLQMVGTIKKAEQYWALIKAINGTIYPIRIGEYIGQNNGLVVNVTADAIILEEKIQLNGEWQSHKIQLRLKQ